MYLDEFYFKMFKEIDMHYIVFDMEFNQDFSSLQDTVKKWSKYPFEIIQIGAVKLDSDFIRVASFNRFVKPTIYGKVSSFITELTGITTEQLVKEQAFPEVYKHFVEFIRDPDSVFCIWGMSDIKELFKNVEYHNLDSKCLPKKYINIQPYVSKYFGLPTKNLLRLQNAVEALHIPVIYSFHNAFFDACYTAEILKKINSPSIKPCFYDPSYVPVKPRQHKREIDYDKLIQQFEKMYARKISKVEQEMIKLAYHMGKTRQFLK
jgi:inhibitor of KinA sporulation pathway (predicted exonuclease)